MESKSVPFFLRAFFYSALLSWDLSMLLAYRYFLHIIFSFNLWKEHTILVAFSHMKLYLHFWRLIFGSYFLNTWPCVVCRHRRCRRVTSVVVEFPHLCSPLVAELMWHQERREKVLSFCSRTARKNCWFPWRWESTDFEVGDVESFFDSFIDLPLSMIFFSSLGTKPKGSIVFWPPQLEPSTDISPLQVR